MAIWEVSYGRVAVDWVRATTAAEAYRIARYRLSEEVYPVLTVKIYTPFRAW